MDNLNFYDVYYLLILLIRLTILVLILIGVGLITLSIYVYYTDDMCNQPQQNTISSISTPMPGKTPIPMTSNIEQQKNKNLIFNTSIHPQVNKSQNITNNKKRLTRN